MYVKTEHRAAGVNKCRAMFFCTVCESWKQCRNNEAAIKASFSCRTCMHKLANKAKHAKEHKRRRKTSDPTVFTMVGVDRLRNIAKLAR